MLDALPLEALVDDVAILGKKGAGKTFTARGEAERLQDLQRRVCAIDPTGVWWGMRLMADGATPSPYQMVVFGGDHADVSLDGASGARLADLVAGGDFSCIVDTKRMTVGERTRLWTEFAERLAQVNRKPIHLLIDEAHLFAPQGRVNDPQSGRMVHATNNLVSGGRALGIRIMLITQRPAKLHKDSLSGVETMVAMRMVAPQDRAAVEDWIREQGDPAKGREIVASLPSLPTGEGWVWSPQLDVLERARFRPIKTFDSSRTPEDGEPETPPVQLGTLDLALLQAALLPDEAAPPAKNKAGTRTGTAPVLDPAALEAAFEGGRAEGFALGYRAGYSAGWRAALLQAEENLNLAALARGPTREPSEKAIATSYSLLGVTRSPEEQARQIATPAAIPAKAPPASDSTHITAADVRNAAAAIVRAARMAPFAVESLADAALLAGFVPSGGYFNGLRKELLAAGWRDAPPNDLANDGPFLSASDLLEAFAAKLRGRNGAADRFFSHLWVIGPQPIDVAAAALGMAAQGGYFNATRKAMTASPLFVKRDDGRWDIAPVLRKLKGVSE
jgi:hypothetical protein